MSEQTPSTLVVTGASRGIGAAIAVLAASRGYSVWVNYHRNEEAACRVSKIVSQAKPGELYFNMNAPLGYALLRDRRVSIRPKLVALGVGLAAAGLIEFLQIPLESVFALILPVVGVTGDVAVDGAEAVIVPVLVATLLMPYLAPPNIVQQLRAERQARA